MGRRQNGFIRAELGPFGGTAQPVLSAQVTDTVAPSCQDLLWGTLMSQTSQTSLSRGVSNTAWIATVSIQRPPGPPKCPLVTVQPKLFPARSSVPPRVAKITVENPLEVGWQWIWSSSGLGLSVHIGPFRGYCVLAVARVTRARRSRKLSASASLRQDKGLL